jgi:hypothetical protein
MSLTAAAVPIGGGLGRVFRFGDRPMSAYVSAYYNAIRPDAAPNLIAER